MAMGGGSGMGDGMGMPMPMPPPPSSMSMPTPMPSDDGMGVTVLFSDWPGDRGLGMYVASLVFVLASPRSPRPSPPRPDASRAPDPAPRRGAPHAPPRRAMGSLTWSCSPSCLQRRSPHRRHRGHALGRHPRAHPPPTPCHDADNSNSGSMLSPGETQIDNTALDGIISHNSLFTGAVFAGLSVGLSNGTGSSSGGGLVSSGCTVGAQVANDLVSYHVFAFALFLFSSLVALALKQECARCTGMAHAQRASTGQCSVQGWCVRAGVHDRVRVPHAGPVNVVQSKLGRIGCGLSAAASSGAVVSLVTLIPTGMVIYTIIVFRAFTHSM
uniref:Uncharacterized protein n=1 Tax=Ananas comosus var. bracteatus TaxID=296719 RepID=A0A6V7NLN4_ANACO|nr:unnamed protein product [Ananas comosus var. bracteatus]